MKATGIVRRIDDLGRVVIPKEIRRTMRIREGDPLEIFTDADGEVVFKKYSPIGEMSTTSKQYAEVLFRSTNQPVIITDRDRVIAVAGLSKKEIIDRRVTPALEGVIEGRASYVAGPESDHLLPVEGIDRRALIACPIIAGGDVSGCVVLTVDENGAGRPNEADVKLIQVAASFLGRQMEE
ncbi:MAG: AbrB/MazE/SpoVT family DNA-binding domain-containing protein [Oscillospiraceae bacterium]|jgi:AbrB family transcriptional regulator (stage V sporulation protein T)|nr:AbrB/MazE/SpoVT family DNA-binding domain-containing protein [Oscillospiraceae bacterium]